MKLNYFINYFHVFVYLESSTYHWESTMVVLPGTFIFLISSPFIWGYFGYCPDPRPVFLYPLLLADGVLIKCVVACSRTLEPAVPRRMPADWAPQNLSPHRGCTLSRGGGSLPMLIGFFMFNLLVPRGLQRHVLPPGRHPWCPDHVHVHQQVWSRLCQRRAMQATLLPVSPSMERTLLARSIEDTILRSPAKPWRMH